MIGDIATVFLVALGVIVVLAGYLYVLSLALDDDWKREGEE